MGITDVIYSIGVVEIVVDATSLVESGAALISGVVGIVRVAGVAIVAEVEWMVGAVEGTIATSTST